MSDSILNPSDGNGLAVCEIVAYACSDNTVDHISVSVILLNGSALDNNILKGYLCEIICILNGSADLIPVISGCCGIILKDS